jgi:hypothetical protein
VDRPHHEREGHDARGECRSRPAERDDDSDIGEQRANWPPPPKKKQQAKAGDNRGQHQREADQPVDQALAEEAPRASSRAVAIPKGRLTSVATVAMRGLKPMAVHSSVESKNMGRVSWGAAHYPHPEINSLANATSRAIHALERTS